MFFSTKHEELRLATSTTTVVLTNWKRTDNLRLIIDQLTTQTERPEIFLWNNNPPFSHPGIGWQVDSSVNRYCWPRWLMASFATTEFVVIMDDDLIFTDTQVLTDALAMLRTCPERTAIGINGVKLDQAKQYAMCENVIAGTNGDRQVDLLKGRCIMLRTSALQNLKLQPSPAPETLICDDILVSGALAEGKPGMHIVPAVFAGRWKELPEPHALWKMPGHFECRERARRIAFPDKLPTS